MQPAATATPDTSTLREYLLLALLATLWGGSYTLIKLGVATIPPLTLVAGRTLIAGLVLLLVLRVRRIPLPRDPQVWRLLLVQAVLNFVIPFSLIAWAELGIEAGLATILNATTPVFVVLLSALLPGQAMPGGIKFAGVALGLGGVGLIIGMQALTGAGGALLPQFAIVAATVSYACSVLYARRFRGVSPLVSAAGSLLCGAAMLVPLALLVDRPWTLQPSADSLAALVVLATLSTALAFAIYFHLLGRLGAVGTSAQAYLRVPAGVAIGVLFLGERLSATAWIGFACVIAGVAAMSLRWPLRRAV